MISQGAALGAKAQQLAALQASIASKLSQVAHQLSLLPFLRVVAHLTDGYYPLPRLHNYLIIRCCPQSYPTNQCR